MLRCRGDLFFSRGANNRRIQNGNGSLMKEWLLPIAPVAVLIYFAAFPDKFAAFVGWAGHYMH
jgi:hypothetical protein